MPFAYAVTLWLFLHVRLHLLQVLFEPSSLFYSGFPGGSDVKEPDCQCRKTWVQFLSREYPLEKRMATHSSILAWEVHGVAKNQIQLSDLTTHARTQPVLLTG